MTTILCLVLGSYPGTTSKFHREKIRVRIKHAQPSVLSTNTETYQSRSRHQLQLVEHSVGPLLHRQELHSTTALSRHWLPVYNAPGWASQKELN